MDALLIIKYILAGIILTGVCVWAYKDNTPEG